MGTNDVRRGAPASLVIAGLKDIIARVHAKGIKVIGATIIPRHNQPDNSWNEAKTRVKNEINAWIRGEADFDSVIDFDRVVRDRGNPSLIQAAYGCGDGVHPSPMGYFLMGRAVNLSVFDRERPGRG